MDKSNWFRALERFDEPKPISIPTKRGCERCRRVAELVDLSPEGAALYLCSERHQTIIDVSSAMQLH
jgi:hypothetical protein